MQLILYQDDQTLYQECAQTKRAKGNGRRQLSVVQNALNQEAVWLLVLDLLLTSCDCGRVTIIHTSIMLAECLTVCQALF